MNKVKRAAALPGPAFIHVFSPCPTGWDYDPRETVNIGRLAVKTGVWPLKEYVNGEIVHTRVPRQRAPVEEYLKLQGRFNHLLEPQRNEALLADIQAKVDAYWENVPVPGK